ncbi:hypothetical protein dsx2_0510 [Desulfovibrio sp. X2]|uniref:hypothetical protein n=1 Tax=Desulfovibrio sp. X2 TaxID=941449 RepID=UPI0003587A9F|nr:hypothetical protein [Desulfovibrio sp. X2]EPR38701.1 hypothetical protein dsx2_0510 [Desulfovibrio sp. X2]
MRLLEFGTYLFDPLHSLLERESTHRRITAGLVIVFLLGLAGIELKRQGLLPPPLAALTPDNHFHAVHLAFTLLLALEVVGLIFSLPCSVSKSVGKQFEILALILLRGSFEELVNFPEPVQLEGRFDALWHIVADGVGALAIFVILGFYYRIQRHRTEIMRPQDRFAFVASKKIVALILLVVFACMAAWNVWLMARGEPHFDFFDSFYTVLIFCDILLVLISQQYLPAFHAVLRNSGYAVATLLLRLSLTAPPIANAAIGVGAGLFALCLTYAYDHLYMQSTKAGV